MGKRNARIVVKVNRDFVNTSKLACMSHYRCGQVIPKDEEFVVCEWTETEEDIVDILRSIIQYHSTLSNRDIDAIINNLFNAYVIQKNNVFWHEKQRIYTLVYVESLLNQGLVEVEWYDDWLQ